jgi:UDP-N-acetylglucosamine acyltransferase
MNKIHPTAVVDPSAQIDKTVEIGPYAIIGADVVIGPECSVGPHAIVEYTHMGRGNKIFGGSFLGGAPQDLKYAGEKTRLVMGDYNTVRECATLNRGTIASGETRIGSHCLFMTSSHVAHDCRIGDHVILVNCVAAAGHVTIGDYAVIGGFAGIHQFARIGRLCMIGAGAMVGKDVPPFCTCQGDRATIRGLNLLGLRRAGIHRESVSAIKNAYKTLFMSGLRLETALAQLKEGSPVPEVLEMVSSIEKASKHGIIRPASGAALEEEVTV